MTSILLWVPGDPVPQGAMTGFRDKRGNVRVKASNEGRLARWRADVRAAAQAEGVQLQTGPVEVELRILLRRPTSHYGSGRHADLLRDTAPAFPTARSGPAGGDVDKFARAVLDALTEIAWLDDAQVVGLTVSKEWCDSRADPTGCVIQIDPAEVPEIPISVAGEA